MILKDLSLVNFKNYTQFDASFCAKINCLVGQNGMGKTNLLDAIHYLTFCKSYFNPIDSQNISYNEGFFVIQGTIEKQHEEIELYCAIKRNQKKIFKKNKKEYDKLSDHIGSFPMVMISPGDSELISGISELRRRFMDSIISQYDKTYLDQLIAYNKVLKQRNALLKQFAEMRSFDSVTLEIWDEQLVTYGQKVLQTRRIFLEQFIPLFNTHYQHISNSSESVSIAYASSLKQNEFKQALALHIAKDRLMQYTGIGPHKDDLDFELKGMELKKYASQGQQKSFLLALKLAQFDFLADKKNLKPLLLLDDVYDKLDAERFSKLIERVSSDAFGQVFITDTHPERMQALFKNRDVECKFFTIEEGALRSVNDENYANVSPNK